MNPIIDPHREQLDALCRKHRVARLDLFGSAATGEFDPDTSDLDFLVTFQSMTPTDHRTAYFGLRRDIQALFGRSVDLIEENAVRNPIFLEIVNETKTALYAA
ncbi:MAG: nucleotidyltransferase domain-containing protein [Candidatus Poribacteria bacterium]|nr:nucleotidyltransferase domain-containing protein [Candidatus Poribacteria bacterium]